MPSSKAKAKNAAAHQHDKRHESGLAAPGKRVVRQRSNNSLATIANGRPADFAPAVHTTALAGSEHHLDHTRPLENGRGVQRSLTASRIREDGPWTESGHRERTESDASYEGGAYLHGDTDDGQPDDPAYYSTNEHMRRSGYASQSANSLKMVATILTYYPLRDAISILILLLSLPATLVLIIQTLFASLTFVPPTAGISLPSIKDLFNASSLGYPALATILFVDLLFYLCWLPLWRPVQDLLLDLSQAVVAVSLSGAAASTGGSTYSIATCSAVVCVVHVLRHKAVHLTALDYLRSVLHKTDLGIHLSVPFTSNSFFNNNMTSATEQSWIFSAVRTILGIHIVSQGLTTCIRRSLANQNEKPAVSPALTRTDTEALIGHEAPRNNTQDQLTTSTPPNGPSPHSRDTRARESGRRRRKQAIEIRGNQPLWAAIASTKVTFVKEMDQRDVTDDAKESAALEHCSASTRPSAKSVTNRIWINCVQDTEVSLSAELAVSKSSDSQHRQESPSQSRPFHVRINGAVWNTIKATPASSSSCCEHVDLEIFGLAPHTSYQCDLVANESNTSLCVVSFVTQSAQIAEQVAPIVPPVPSHQTLRPSSPATTLRRSIELASASLAEAKNKTKKTRKDQRAAYSDIRKEIKDLKHKLDNGGGNDEKQNRRLLQFTQHKNQADDAAVNLMRQISDLGEMPAEDVATAEASKSLWQAASKKREAAQQRSDNLKSEADREVREVKNDMSAAEQKRERLSSRLQQRKDELASAAAKHKTEQDSRQKHLTERANRRDEQDKLEAQLRFHIASMNNETEAHNAKGIEAYQQGQTLQTMWHDLSSPPTPDNARHVANGISQALSNGFYGTQHFDVSYAQHQPAHLSRGRSSSMLSEYSGFTDDVEDGTIRMAHETTWPLQKTGFGTAVIDLRKESEVSSGSSGTNESTASSSPRPDALARPFIPSRMSPIAPPARKTASPQITAAASRLASHETAGGDSR